MNHRVNLHVETISGFRYIKRKCQNLMAVPLNTYAYHSATLQSGAKPCVLSFASIRQPKEHASKRYQMIKKSIIFAP
jgi:hypothetical protein